MGRIVAAPLRLQLETVLECSAETAWREECRVEHLFAISRPLIVFRSDDRTLPDRRWRQGQVLELRGYAFGVVPLGRHRVEVVLLDPARREIHTAERGGSIRLWRHRVRISPQSPARCRYLDDILLDAGPLTAALWLFAWLTYRLRQRRRRSLARRLGARAPRPPAEP